MTKLSGRVDASDDEFARDCKLIVGNNCHAPTLPKHLTIREIHRRMALIKCLNVPAANFPARKRLSPSVSVSFDPAAPELLALTPARYIGKPRDAYATGCADYYVGDHFTGNFEHVICFT
jgi:hypothetical protein